MKILSKQTIASMVAGTFMMAGVAAPFIVQAADIQQPPSAQHQAYQKGSKDQKVSPEIAAQRLSDAFGIDQATILKYNAGGMSFREIGRAAMLANAGSTTLEDVISHKTKDNTWRDVAKAMGITKDQMKAARQTMVANRLDKKIGLDKEVTLDLLHQGYHAKDIGMAAELAKNTSKPIADVLSLKKTNNTWLDVATTLGVDKDTFKKDMQELGYGHHHKGHKGQGENGAQQDNK